MYRESVEPEDYSIRLIGYEMIEKKVGKSGNSGYIYVPAKWIGKKVVVLLQERIEE